MTWFHGLTETWENPPLRLYGSALMKTSAASAEAASITMIMVCGGPSGCARAGAAEQDLRLVGDQKLVVFGAFRREDVEPGGIDGTFQQEPRHLDRVLRSP